MKKLQVFQPVVFHLHNILDTVQEKLGAPPIYFIEYIFTN